MGKKKNKNLLINQKGDLDLFIEGRHQCLCEASRHDLINNCLICGRIVCQQEGIGPCFTCGTYVTTKEDRSFLLSGSKEACLRIEELKNSGIHLDFIDKIVRKRSLKEIAASLNKDQTNLDQAIKHKDKMLDFDKNSVVRSTVYDDQIDYFTMRNQNFITNEKRKTISDKIDYLIDNKFKKIDKINIDLENCRISDFQEPVIQDIDEEHRMLENLSQIKTDYEKVPSSQFINDKESTAKRLPIVYIPNLYDDYKIDEDISLKTSLSRIKYLEQRAHRIQNIEIDSIEDRGWCLAMRQPWASLLVLGIKKFEGRTWYSPFRGRLWIYAALKKPTEDEINLVESSYLSLGNLREKFPKSYPLGEIVGCVTIEDCLPNQVCREKYPNNESDSPYVFVCDYPLALEQPLPVAKGGGEKIYKLEPNIHKACKKLLGF